MNFDFDAGFAEMVLLARFEPGASSLPSDF